MKFWADENFNGRILKGILLAYPELVIIRVQDTELISLPDPELLEEAYKADAILLTHDIKTLVPYAKERLSAGIDIAGVIAIPSTMAIGHAIEHVITLIGAANEGDFHNSLIRL